MRARPLAARRGWSVWQAMNEQARSDQSGELIGAAELRLVGIDELSTVRYIHAAALRAQARSCLSEADVNTFTRYVYSDAYTRCLSEAARTNRLIGAVIARELVGTAGWLPANDSGAIARMHGVFVRPLFTGGGLGRKLALAAEEQAGQAGFSVFTVRATLNAVEFFSRLDYEASSRGAWTLGPRQIMQVAFMRKRLHGLRLPQAGSQD
jgi:GNAT superfamily N-acetyltransferase